MALHRVSGNRRLGLTLASITMLIWATLPFALDLLLDVMPPASIVWWRFLVASLFVGLLVWRRGELPALGALGRRERGLLVVATLGLALNYIAFLLGLDWTSAATAQVLIQMGPLFLALGGLLIFKESFTRWQGIGFSVLVAGLLLFFGGRFAVTPASGEETLLFGSAAIALGAFTWAVYGLAQKQLLVAMPSQSLMLCIYLGCALCFTPLADPGSVRALDATGVAALLYGCMATAVAYGCFSAALAHIEASRVSAVIALVPIGTLALAQLATALAPERFPADPLTAWSLVGAAAVVGGSMMAALGAKDPLHDASEASQG